MTGTAAGPRWTRARLERILCLRFGYARDGLSPDTAAVAEAMGVSRRTVQRWLHGSSGRETAHIPPRRREQLIGLVLPSADALAREDFEAQYARSAIEGMTRRGRKWTGGLPIWSERRWLEPHRVAVVEIPLARPAAGGGAGPASRTKIRQILIARDDPAHGGALGRRGRVIDEAVVPTRFHATILVQQTLAAMGPWRFQAAPTQVKKTFTRAWMADGTTPPTRLEDGAAALLRDLSKRRRRTRPAAAHKGETL